MENAQLVLLLGSVGSFIVTHASIAWAQGAPADTASPQAQPAPEVSAQATAGAGGPGESCRARTDCEQGLKCVAQVCRDEMEGASCRARADCGGRLACVSGECVVPGQAPKGTGGGGGAAGREGGGAGASSGGGTDGLLESELEGIRPHIGLIFGGGPSHTDETRFPTVGSLLFALKGGVLIDRLEVGLEFSPATFVLSFDPDFPSVQLNGYGGYHIPIYEAFSWPLRLGVGFTTPTFRGEAGDTVFEARADLVGLSVFIDPMLLDIYLPSFRVNTDFEDGALFTYIFGVGAAWAPEI
jgi:hypothetical protein